MADPFFAPERLETDSFVVRSYYPGDGPLLAEALNASYDHLKTFMDWIQPHTSDDGAEGTARRFCAEYLLNKDFVLSVWSPESAPSGRRLLGGSGFHMRGGSVDGRAAEIGMWIRADAAGKGLGTRVLVALLEWGFSAWPWERLLWRCDTKNVASRRTAEKAGMLYEGCARSEHLYPDGTRGDMLYFGALRGEWSAPELVE